MRNVTQIRKVIRKYAGCSPRENEVFEIGREGVSPLIAHLLSGSPDIPEPEPVDAEEELVVPSPPPVSSVSVQSPAKRIKKLTTDFGEVFKRHDVKKVRIRFMDTVENVEHLK